MQHFTPMGLRIESQQMSNGCDDTHTLLHGLSNNRYRSGSVVAKSFAKSLDINK